MEIEYKEIGKCLPYMDRDKLYEERDSIMAEQRKLSSRIKVLDRALRATTDELADLYLTLISKQLLKLRLRELFI